jgi:predicted ester cyclase
MMSIPEKSEHNKKFVMRCTFIHHEGVTEEEIRAYTNNETYIQGVLSFRKAFPDYTIDVEDITAEGDFVILHGTFRGTHKGEFHGIPASYNKVVFPMMNKYHIIDDKIVNAWPMFDQLAFFEQLGMLHKPG